MAVGKNITWKRDKLKQYHLPFNIKDVGKNINWGRGDRIFRDENQDLEKWGSGRISSCRTLYSSLTSSPMISVVAS